jgi:hypothetical protein
MRRSASQCLLNQQTEIKHRDRLVRNIGFPPESVTH